MSALRFLGFVGAAGWILSAMLVMAGYNPERFVIVVGFFLAGLFLARAAIED